MHPDIHLFIIICTEARTLFLQQLSSKTSAAFKKILQSRSTYLRYIICSRSENVLFSWLTQCANNAVTLRCDALTYLFYVCWVCLWLAIILRLPCAMRKMIRAFIAFTKTLYFFKRKSYKCSFMRGTYPFHIWIKSIQILQYKTCKKKKKIMSDFSFYSLSHK